MGYVSVDGNFGYDQAILFDNGDLTEEEWATLDELSDSEKFVYVRDVLLVKGK